MRSLEQEYFEWLCSKIYYEGFGVNYSKLLSMLYDYDFIPIIDMDNNRVEDGRELMRRFAIEKHTTLNALLNEGLTGVDQRGTKYCSILEMMVALAIRCEETLMTNAEDGDKTSLWFFNMIESLGLIPMTDSNFEYKHVTQILDRFIDRKYDRNGKGGLFTIEGVRVDMRDVEIWYQMCWYLDTIII